MPPDLRETLTEAPGRDGPRLRVGDLLAGRFLIEAELGEGGMGAVYRARDEDLDDQIAVKVLRPEISAAPGALERFRREVKLARRVTHPNVARTFDLGTDGAVRFLTMELLRGTALSRRPLPMPLPEALRVGTEIARGLVAAHAAGVVHRDLKPDNVMLEESGRVAITDFGIARGLDPAAPRVTDTFTALGTPAYMAPEQVEGRPLDGRADVYALGVLLFELLTGRLPFEGDSVFAVAAARLTLPAPDPRGHRPDIPAAVAELVRAAMARKREDRPSAADVARRLEGLRGGRGEHDAHHEPTPMSLAPRSSMSPVSYARAAPAQLSVGALDAAEGDAASAGYTARAIEALCDTLSGVRGLRVGAPDLHAAGSPIADGQYVVEASVRVASGKVRARARLLIGRKEGAEQLWSQRVDGLEGAWLAQELDLCEQVRAALAARTVGADGRRGPSDATAREIYFGASVDYQSFEPKRVAEAVAALESAVKRHPDDPFLVSALGAGKTRLWALRGAIDAAALEEAEELCLRALALDASIGETFESIAILRLQQGELRAAVQALQEAIARAPLAVEAHFYLARLLCECGHTTEGLRHLDLALRLNPKHPLVQGERLRTVALMGDEARAAALGEELALASGTLIVRLRLALWAGDYDAIGRLVGKLKSTASDGTFAASFLPAVPTIEALRDPATLGPVVGNLRKQVVLLTAAPRFRTFLGQVLVELLCVARDEVGALEELEAIAPLPLIDVLWLDGCPVLAALRKEPRFAAVRAIVAARAAALWA